VELYGLVAACSVLSSAGACVYVVSVGPPAGAFLLAAVSSLELTHTSASPTSFLCVVHQSSHAAGMGSTPRLLLDPTADEERAAEGDGDEEPEQDGSRSGSSSSSSSRKRPRAGAKSRGRGRRALGLLHLALMPASGEVTQVKGRGVRPKRYIGWWG